MAFAAVLAPAALIGPFFLGGSIEDGGGIAAAAAFGALAYALYRYARNIFSAAFPVGVVVAAMLLAYWPAYRQVMPGLTELWVSTKLVDAFKTNQPAACSGTPTMFTVGYNEPSLIFLAGNNTRHGKPAQAAAFLAQAPDCHLAAVDQRFWDDFETALAGLPITEHATVTGLNYSKGRKMLIRLVQISPADTKQ